MTAQELQKLTSPWWHQLQYTVCIALQLLANLSQMPQSEKTQLLNRLGSAPRTMNCITELCPTPGSDTLCLLDYMLAVVLTLFALGCMSKGTITSAAEDKAVSVSHNSSLKRPLSPDENMYLYAQRLCSGNAVSVLSAIT